VMSPPTETSRTKHKRETENSLFVGQSKWVRMFYDCGSHGFKCSLRI
jgi:hypothetical protein